MTKHKRLKRIATRRAYRKDENLVRVPHLTNNGIQNFSFAGNVVTVTRWENRRADFIARVDAVLRDARYDRIAERAEWEIDLASKVRRNQY